MPVKNYEMFKAVEEHETKYIQEVESVNLYDSLDGGGKEKKKNKSWL